MKNSEWIINIISESLIGNFVYDVVKIAFALIIVKILYEKLYLNRKWGKWSVKINKNGKQILKRELSTAVSKKIFEDLGEFSIYIKGIISPYGWLNIDIASNEAKEIGLIYIDKNSREIKIDLDKNPSKKNSNV